ncbi:uncharacterized protein B0H64DRAFT_38353 [Chaetomium fimeti]|uniref:Uncharacterized protein n=1 Tax=Chaetomium fimeti TaxID=1854472 RepID=A0AAE0HS52_9PEZI|nr:hypothetical protein B0H64DRAFT_38353 [Chaetomium fimeti]
MERGPLHVYFHFHTDGKWVRSHLSRLGACFIAFTRSCSIWERRRYLCANMFWLIGWIGGAGAECVWGGGRVAAVLWFYRLAFWLFRGRLILLLCVHNEATPLLPSLFVLANWISGLCLAVPEIQILFTISNTYKLLGISMWVDGSTAEGVRVACLSGTIGDEMKGCISLGKGEDRTMCVDGGEYIHAGLPLEEALAVGMVDIGRDSWYQ